MQSGIIHTLANGGFVVAKKKSVKKVVTKAAPKGRNFEDTKGGYRGPHCLRCGKVADKCEASNCPGA